MKSAKIVLELYERWSEIDSDQIADNLRKALNDLGYSTHTGRMDALISVTKSSKHAVYAWINRGRGNVKVPFIKLCMISDGLDIDINRLLK